MPAAGLNRRMYNTYTCMYMYLLLQLHVNSSEIGHIEMLHHGYAYKRTINKHALFCCFTIYNV